MSQFGLPTITRSELAAKQGLAQPAPTAPVQVASSTAIQTTDPILELLDLHYRKQKTMILWGSSGFGKSSTVKAFAKSIGAEFLPVFAITLDPLTTSVPVVDQTTKQIDSYPCGWLKEACDPNGKPTVLLLDEINKFSNPSVQNMLNEIILDRRYGSHKIRDNVFIVACANFVAESEQASPLDCSILKRVTNVLFAPDSASIINNMQSALGKTLAGILKPQSKGKELFKEEVLSQLSSDVPRQIDEVGFLCEGETLSTQAVEMLCIGRVGEKGKDLVQPILRSSTYVNVLDSTTIDKVVKMHDAGARVEVQGLIEQGKDSNAACEVVFKTKSPLLAHVVLKKYGAELEFNGKSFIAECFKSNLVKAG